MARTKPRRSELMASTFTSTSKSDLSKQSTVKANGTGDLHAPSSKLPLARASPTQASSQRGPRKALMTMASSTTSSIPKAARKNRAPAPAPTFTRKRKRGTTVAAGESRSDGPLGFREVEDAEEEDSDSNSVDEEEDGEDEEEAVTQPDRASEDDEDGAPVGWHDRKVFTTYISFRHESTDESFRTGDFLYIAGNPEDSRDPEKRERWIGKVVLVRAMDARTVYTEIAWLFSSAPQLKECGIQLPKSQSLAKNEYILSDIRDIISVWTVEGRANIKRFNESDPWQEEIADDEEFYRSQIVKDDRTGKMVVRSINAPKAGTKKGKAEKPYRPQQTKMVYCPRSSCRKWYHLSQCRKIAQATRAQLASIRTSGLELLALRSRNANPNGTTAANAPPTPAASGSSISPHKFSQAGGENQEEEDEEEEMSDDLHTIYRFAKSSIMRGMEYGIVGNSIAVLEAREVVKWLKLSRSITESTPENKEEAKMAAAEAEELTTTWLEKHDPEDDEVDDGKRFECPACRMVC